MMKKIVILLILTAFIAGAFASCGKNGAEKSTDSSSGTAGITFDDTKSTDAPIKPGKPSHFQMTVACIATQVLVYNDTVYYNCYSLSNNVPTKIKYQNLNNIQQSGAELGADPLSSESLGGLFSGVDEWPFFLIDEEATAENGGIPVFIICCNYSGVYKIFSYNSKNNKVNVIHTELEEMEWLALYGEYIFYVTYEGDKGRIIHRVGKDGSGHIEMENENAISNGVKFIYEDKIYYTMGSNKLYSMNLDFSGSEYLFDAVTNPAPFIEDGYIYYLGNLTKTENGMGNKAELCRRSLSDISAEETVLEDIGIGMYRNGIFYYFKYSNDGTAYDKNTVYGYKVSANESFVALHKPDINGGLTYLGWNEEYLVCRFTKDRKSYYLVVNIETGEEFTMQAAK